MESEPATTAATPTPELRPGPLTLRLVVVLIGSNYPTDYIAARYLDTFDARLQLVFQTATLALISGTLVWLLVVGPLRRAVAAERRRRVAREQDLVAETGRQRFAARLGRGVDMAEDEEQVLGVLRRALASEFDDVPAALLLADSSGSHLRTALDTAPEGARRCAVVEPRSCPAIRSGDALRFPDPSAVDACPELRDTSRGGAVCVPMQAGGRAVGVLHLPIVDDTPPPPSSDLSQLVTTLGRRLGMVRVVAQTSHQARTDGLTGLRNRRSAEDDATQALATVQRAAVVLCDLDHFKQLNDTHGHATGDRALRVFARSMIEVFRPDDIVSRFGGEEFLIVMPGADSHTAASTVDRLREHLAQRLAGADVPTFTASFGIADTTAGRDLDALVRLADEALYRAKHAGRDRSVLAGEHIEGAEHAEQGVAHAEDAVGAAGDGRHDHGRRGGRGEARQHSPAADDRAVAHTP